LELKANYLDHLSDVHSDVRIMCWTLDDPERTLGERLERLQGHYMKEIMLNPQIVALEPPPSDEVNIIAVDVFMFQAEVAGLVTDLITELLAR